MFGVESSVAAAVEQRANETRQAATRTGRDVVGRGMVRRGWREELALEGWQWRRTRQYSSGVVGAFGGCAVTIGTRVVPIGKGNLRFESVTLSRQGCVLRSSRSDAGATHRLVLTSG